MSSSYGGTSAIDRLRARLDGRPHACEECGFVNDGEWEAATSGAFLAAARSLMTFYEEESLQVRGFQSGSAEAREFAKFVLDTIRDKGEKAAGRWNKFGGRGSLFPFRK